MIKISYKYNSLERFKKSDVLGILSEVVSEGILIVDEQQNITASNTVADRMFGYTKDELRGKPLEILIPESERKSHRGKVSGFMKVGEARNMGFGLDLVGLKKDGDIFPLEISLNPFNLQQKGYVMALVVDVTERKKAEQTIDYWFQIFDESLNEIYVFDAQTLIFINVNRGAQLNLGYNLQELNQMSVLNSWLTSDRNLVFNSLSFFSALRASCSCSVRSSTLCSNCCV